MEGRQLDRGVVTTATDPAGQMVDQNGKNQVGAERTGMLERLRVVLGSYDGWLYGWEGRPHGEERSGEEGNPLRLSFAYESHAGCVKATSMATSGSTDFLVTGGADEVLRVSNLNTKREVGELHSHTGAITCMEFFSGQHLLSGSADKTIRIWKAREWECLHVLGGHKEELTCLAIHPSGKLALSGARDKVIIMWNLMEGRIAYRSRLKQIPEDIVWAPDGKSYAISFLKEVLVYDVAEGEIVAQLDGDPDRLQTCAYLTSNLMVTGGNSGKIRFWSTDDEGKLLCEVESLRGERVRAVKVVQDDCSADSPLLISVTSRGAVQIWKSQWKNLSSNPPTCVCQLIDIVRTGTRITAMSVSLMASSTSNKKSGASKKRYRSSYSEGQADAEDRNNPAVKKSETKKKRRKEEEEEGGGGGGGC